MFNKTFFAALVTWTLLAGACGRHDDELDLRPPGSPGGVLPKSCASGCQTGFRCSSGECKIDPSSLWIITITDGTVSERDPANEAWDAFGGLPDPYACITINGTRSCTSTRQDTLKPRWNESLDPATSTALLSGIQVELWDEDVSSNDPICGKGLIALSESDIAEGQFSASCKTGSINARIAPKWQ